MSSTPARAWIVVSPGSAAEKLTPVDSRLLVGRECRGAPPGRCLIIDDPVISRDHLELRVDPAHGAVLVDLSTNGTWLNGRRVERGEPQAVRDGDVIELGSSQLVFHTDGEVTPEVAADELTLRASDMATLAIVVGDIVGYSTLIARHGASAVAAAVDTLFANIRTLLERHRGTVHNYVGDAIFAAWDANRDPAARVRAIDFVLAAHGRVSELEKTLGIGDPPEPLRVGWAVTYGDAVMGRPSHGHATAHGDAVTLAFRLASTAGRASVPPILASVEATDDPAEAARYGQPFEIAIKGHTRPARVRSVSGISGGGNGRA